MCIYLLLVIVLMTTSIAVAVLSLLVSFFLFFFLIVGRSTPPTGSATSQGSGVFSQALDVWMAEYGEPAAQDPGQRLRAT